MIEVGFVLVFLSGFGFGWLARGVQWSGPGEHEG
jgi:hypothetical protein